MESLLPVVVAALLNLCIIDDADGVPIAYKLIDDAVGVSTA
jgi:hypothetical protein